MADAVVDPLEAVEVEEQDGTLLGGGRGGKGGVERLAVEKAGQPIGPGRPGRSPFGEDEDPGGPADQHHRRDHQRRRDRGDGGQRGQHPVEQVGARHLGVPGEEGDRAGVAAHEGKRRAVRRPDADDLEAVEKDARTDAADEVGVEPATQDQPREVAVGHRRAGVGRLDAGGAQGVGRAGMPDEEGEAAIGVEGNPGEPGLDHVEDRPGQDVGPRAAPCVGPSKGGREGSAPEHGDLGDVARGGSGTDVRFEPGCVALGDGGLRIGPFGVVEGGGAGLAQDVRQRRADPLARMAERLVVHGAGHPDHRDADGEDEDRHGTDHDGGDPAGQSMDAHPKVPRPRGPKGTLARR